MESPAPTPETDQQPEWFRKMMSDFLDHTALGHAADVEKYGVCKLCGSVKMTCYSDHDHDVITKGVCDYCLGTEYLE